MATMTDTVTTTLNSLLRGEMSAIETYRQAIEKLDNEVGAQDLHWLRKEHRDAADALWHHVEQHGAKPSEDSGPWGAFAKAVEGTAKLFGNAAALKALKEGEEHGLKDYEDALGGHELPADCQALLRGLLERQRAHLPVIDRLLEQHK
ncbi:MAG TPA: DUF2383 domain-containing protein [Thermoanaerobaculia bacterium]|nr:DUF2383 domain-containing protein [Thermoanaerobaculia bacterium]